MKASGMSVVATYFLSIASITQVRKSIYKDTVGDEAFSFVIRDCCVHPSVQALPLIMPVRFSLRNMK
jgi:hypothetical protein